MCRRLSSSLDIGEVSRDLNQLEQEELPKFSKAVLGAEHSLCVVRPLLRTGCWSLLSCPRAPSSAAAAPSHREVPTTKKCLVCAPETTGESPDAALYLQCVSVQFPLIYLQWFVRYPFFVFTWEEKSINPINFPFLDLLFIRFPGTQNKHVFSTLNPRFYLSHRNRHIWNPRVSYLQLFELRCSNEVGSQEFRGLPCKQDGQSSCDLFIIVQIHQWKRLLQSLSLTFPLCTQSGAAAGASDTL